MFRGGLVFHFPPFWSLQGSRSRKRERGFVLFSILLFRKAILASFLSSSSADLSFARKVARRRKRNCSGIDPLSALKKTIGCYYCC